MLQQQVPIDNGNLPDAAGHWDRATLICLLMSESG